MQSLPQLSSLNQTHLVAAFLSGRNGTTLRAYRRDLEDFRTFVGAPTIDEAAKALLSHSHGEANALALAYKTSLMEKGLQPATINRRLASLRSLVKLARTLGIVSWYLEVENMRYEPYRDTRGPGREGFRALLDEAKKGRKNKALRDQAILRLLYDLGLRRGEVVALNLEDFDLAAGTLAIMGKGRTQKVNLTLPEQTKSALLEWLPGRGIAPGPLFTNLDPAKKGCRLSATGIYFLVRKLGEKVGIKVRPHGLRHSAITEALEVTGGNIRAVARFSRHKNIQTLTVYDDNRLDIGGDVARLVASRV